MVPLQRGTRGRTRGYPGIPGGGVPGDTRGYPGTTGTAPGAVGISSREFPTGFQEWGVGIRAAPGSARDFNFFGTVQLLLVLAAAISPT